jgi:hypothetical protein
MADNPNVASGSSSTPNILDSVGTKGTVQVTGGLDRQPSGSIASNPYKWSNGYPVGSSPTQCYGTGTQVAGQPSMTHTGTYPPFQQLAPKSMSTKPGPMGTDYKS